MSSIQQFIESFVVNPWFVLVSFLIAIISIILAFIFHSKSKKVKLPYYSIRSINIVRDLIKKIEDLDILYDGQPVENLTITKIAFWNGGSDTINNQDIAVADPLTIVVKDNLRILDANILYTKNQANKLSLITSNDQSKINLIFDFIDKDEGVVIQLIHTGKSDEDIELCGTIKGAGKPIYKSIPTLMNSSTSSTLSIKQVRYLFTFIFFILPLIMIPALNVINTEKLYNTIENSPAVKFLLNALMLSIYWVMGFYLLRRRLPKGFDVFEEKFFS